LYLDLVKAAAEAGLSVVRSAQSENLQTKFGTMETASIILADRAEQTCQAFRFDDPSFGVLGWRCTAGTASTDDAQLACFIERITLVDGDAALKSLFAQTERRRTGACGSPARTAAMGSAKPISRP
ncbi:hypothetical protein HI113_45980, partial [Corallococcus exiguus]|uniref:hypothetical protein n=1 Tax=Corallococcus exiguus TaxID=83462 RepID=UPI0017E04318